MPPILFIVAASVFGAAVGSFINVVVWRLPRGESISFPPSHCPHCQKPIHYFDNVPIFAWLWLFGKCRDCRAPISLRYPIVEAIVAAQFALVTYFVFSVSDSFAISTALNNFALSNFLLWTLLITLTTLLAAGLIEIDKKKKRPPIFLALYGTIISAMVLTIFLAT